MKKNYLFIVLFTLLSASPIVLADDAHYAAPAKVECTSNYRCRYDNPYINISSFGPGGGAPAGSYVFSGAEVSQDAVQFSSFVSFFYENEKGERKVNGYIPYRMVRPDVDAPGSQWIKVRARKDSNGYDYACKSTNPKYCGFTHAPWHRDAASLQPSDPVKLLPLQKKNKPNSKLNAVHNTNHLRGNITIRNLTSLPVVINKGDFNDAMLSDPVTSKPVVFPLIIPANSERAVMHYEKLSLKDKLMFDIQIKIGNNNPKMDDRNVTNTAVFLQGEEATSDVVVSNEYLMGERHSCMVSQPNISSTGDVSVAVGCMVP